MCVSVWVIEAAVVTEPYAHAGANDGDGLVRKHALRAKLMQTSVAEVAAHAPGMCVPGMLGTVRIACLIA